MTYTWRQMDVCRDEDIFCTPEENLSVRGILHCNAVLYDPHFMYVHRWRNCADCWLLVSYNLCARHTFDKSSHTSGVGLFRFQRHVYRLVHLNCQGLELRMRTKETTGAWQRLELTTIMLYCLWAGYDRVCTCVLIASRPRTLCSLQNYLLKYEPQRDPAMCRSIELKPDLKSRLYYLIIYHLQMIWMWCGRRVFTCI